MIMTTTGTMYLLRNDHKGSISPIKPSSHATMDAIWDAHPSRHMTHPSYDDEWVKRVFPRMHYGRFGHVLIPQGLYLSNDYGVSERGERMEVGA